MTDNFITERNLAKHHLKSEPEKIYGEMEMLTLMKQKRASKGAFIYCSSTFS